MSAVAAANDRYSDRANDEWHELADAAGRIHDDDKWLPQDSDDTDLLIDRIETHLQANFWRTLDRLSDSNQERREAAREALAEAARKAITDRCYDIAGDA